MSIEIDDPRLTAYVLGELDEDDCKEIEAAIERSEELRRVVSEIRATADKLYEVDFSRLPSPEVADESSAHPLGSSSNLTLRRKRTPTYRNASFED